jgi:hypothetical protein
LLLIEMILLFPCAPPLSWMHHHIQCCLNHAAKIIVSRATDVLIAFP